MFNFSTKIFIHFIQTAAPITTTTTNGKQRKNKANKNAATTVADSKQKQLVPNVTINQGI